MIDPRPPKAITAAPVGETRVLGGVVDVGAYEFRCPADFNRDSVTDPDDLSDDIDAFFSGSC